MLSSPLRVAVVGLGGFAGAHHTQLMSLEAQGLVRVVATCDPAAKDLEERRANYRFRERNVSVHENFSELLARRGLEIDVATVASPVPLHAEHHRQCVENGIACYLEKPPTLDPDELEAMLQVERSATRATQVGFNHIAQPWRLDLKRRLLAGEFGGVQEVSFSGRWRRSPAYFARNSWAGRLRAGGRIVLDSCFGNAMAHHVHNTLFHAGERSLMSWAEPAEVAAELYRANDIDGADTVFVRGRFSNDVRFTIFATHACDEDADYQETIRCEHAEITLSDDGSGMITRSDGGLETLSAPSPRAGILLQNNLSEYFGYLTGSRPRPATLLEDCRPFVHLNALLYVAARRIQRIPPEHLRRLPISPEEVETITIMEIAKAAANFIDQGVFPSESGLPWGAPGGKCPAWDLRCLSEALDNIETP